jgi:hypothetical protein
MAVQQLSVNILSNPKDRDDLFKVIKECSDSMTRADAESDYVRESITEVSKKLQVPKKLVAKMVKVYHKQNYDEEVSTHEQFETLYQTVIK